MGAYSAWGLTIPLRTLVLSVVIVMGMGGFNETEEDKFRNVHTKNGMVGIYFISKCVSHIYR